MRPFRRSAARAGAGRGAESAPRARRLRHTSPMAPTLRAIHVFPIKSGAAWLRDAAEVEPRGLAGDRRWMVTDADGRFLTARQHPRLTLIHARPDGDALEVQAPGLPPLRLQPAASPARLEVTVWKSSVQAQPADPHADAWISRFLGLPARFVHMDAGGVRAVSPEYGRPGDEVSFADGYPLLVISQAALDALNARLARPVPMLRFRPNLVVDGTEPHAEDGWKRIRVGGVEFEVVKPCTRCVFTTVDFERGQFDPSGEPLRTLATYRRTPKGVTFGQNLIPRGRGVVRLGDPVEVLERA
jgi:uncharacterized protein YcbX